MKTPFLSGYTMRDGGSFIWLNQPQKLNCCGKASHLVINRLGRTRCGECDAEFLKTQTPNKSGVDATPVVNSLSAGCGVFEGSK